MSRYPVPSACPDRPHEAELIIRRSRFLAHCARTAGHAEARAFVERIRAAHADATHNCWAYVAGPPGQTAEIGFSDDGEPHGTAGRPMLQLLLHSGLGEICVVVTRWFGGVKLGTGGLVRAYQDSVRAVLAELPQEERVPRCRLRVRVGFAHLDRLHRLLPEVEARLVDESYDAEACLTITLPAARQEEFTALLAGRTDGRAVCEPLTGSPD
ncbi:YigZ family protein [uncultured Desulfovibrio sp.]|uniref:YigZ family protein n=1 Tax=uncultured Desulfovibrio sp. TaxID=167968 RepID=UPI0025F0CEC4|nr:YigZ family protein [uncultured Desulfovibrio sp.]